MKWNPLVFQRRCVQLGVRNACFGFLLPPGFGKTSIMYAIYSLLAKLKYVKGMLVVAPLRPAQLTWPAEALKWDDFKHLKVVVVHGTAKEREKLIRTPADIYVINPEGLYWFFNHPHRPDLDVLCVDESTKFKHTDTQRFKIIKPHLQKFKRRYILTGSPAPNGLIDLFGQVFILDLGRALGQFITHFRKEYFDAVGFQGYSYTAKEGAAVRIASKIEPITLRLNDKEWLDMPPLVGDVTDPRGPTLIEVVLPKGAMAQYKEMEEEFLVQLDSGLVTAANAAVASGKCRQISNGGLYGAERKSLVIHDAKTDALEDLVEQLQGTPCLVAYSEKHDLERLLKRFPDTPYIAGGVTRKRFTEIERLWNQGKVPLLFAQPKSVSHGLNLQGTHGAVVWYSPTYNLEEYEQLIRRVWRNGQKERVLVYHLIAKGTIDMALMKALTYKDDTQRGLLNALRTFYKRAA